MAFKEVPNRVDFPAQERELLGFWKESQAFEKMRLLHQGEPHWSFIDGPITANNPMGVHHGWGRTYKDVMQRFRTMQGHELRYQNGFDCQGLWVEVEVEKEKGFKSKKDIETLGLETFVRLCKARVLRYAAVQTEQSIRLGYWMDWNNPAQLRDLAEKLLEDPQQVVTVQGPKGPVTDTVEQIVGRLGLPEMGGSYFTFSTENNYMIWYFLKRCWEKGWIYHGVDVMPWCPHDATAISQMEIVTDGYSELTHNSVTVRFPLRDAAGQPRLDPQTGLPEALLVWTTTPWTLSSNVAAAVGPELTYARVRQGDQVYYLAKGTLHMLKGPYELLGELKGVDMQGWTYNGPFDELPAERRPGGYTHLKALEGNGELSAQQAHRVILWDEVGETEGTGIVHIAPGCGAEDFQLGKQYGLPLVAPLDEEGHFLDGFDWLTGMQVSQVAEPIFDNLKEKGLLYRVEPYTHRYPTCWRCGTELVFRLVDEWFINMGEVYDKPREQLTAEEKARSLRYQIMDVVDQIKWIPDFGYAREMDWLRNMHDWMISKKRYWGLALPIWTCAECGHFEVIGGEEELKSRAIAGWDTFEGHTPHRPFVDAVKLSCPECCSEMSRIPDVGNPWLDAGIVPFSTLGYRRDPEFWRKWYPAQWITESFPGQFRNWFYSLLAMATVLDQSPPFLQNFGYASLVDETGRPMHKSWGNAIEFNEAADKMGVDVVRWLYVTTKPENDLWFGYNRGDEARRQFLIPLWNAYSFFVTYANLDGWMPSAMDGDAPFDPNYPEGATPRSDNLLDRWVLARLNQLVKAVTEHLEESDFMDAANAVGVFIDDLTNWYVRRSRRRFWKSEQDADKNSAYATFYHVLVKLSRLLAPFTPFVTETMYQNLVRMNRPEARESVHQTCWPEMDVNAVDQGLLDQMALARQVASLGLAARGAANLKVRQPLARAMAFAGGSKTLSPELVEIVTDELNVKVFEFVDEAGKLVNYRVLPDNKLLGPKFGAQFPKVRAAISAADPVKVAAAVQAGEPVTVVVDGQPVELAPNEVLVQTTPVEGLSVMTDKGISVALDATLTPELKAEGMAREIVRRIQDMRKKAGFNIEDRIETYYQAENPSDILKAVLANWAPYLCAETLTVNLVNGPAPDGAYVEEQQVDGDTLILGVRRK
jgi:isoleucyl-tRNA synthetase